MRTEEGEKDPKQMIRNILPNAKKRVKKD